MTAEFTALALWVLFLLGVLFGACVASYDRYVDSWDDQP